MMKKFLVSLLLLISGYAMAQPANYVPYASRNRYIALMADSTFHIPRFNGSPSLRTGGSTNDGALAADTANGRLYMYYNGSWSLINKDTANSFISSIYRKSGTDSVFYIKGGSHTFAFKDSLGTGGGGGGSSSDSTLQQVTDNGDSTTNRLVTNDSLKAQDAWIHGSLYSGDTLYTRGDSLLAFGSSITAGSGVSTSLRFSYLIAQAYGMIEANYGGGGNTIDAVYAALYKIPTKTSNRGALMFEYNMNDATSSDTTTWKTKMQVIIDTAVARGWTKNKIIIVGGPFSEASARTYLANYVRAGRTVAETNGTQYFDAYTFMQTRGGTALTQDSVHPTTLGHAVMFQASKTAFLQFKKRGLVDVNGSVIGRKNVFAGVPPSSTVYPAAAALVVNGKASFQDKIYVGSDTTGYGNAGIVNITASSGQTGLTVKDAGATAYSYIYGGEYWAVNSSNQSIKYRSTDIVIGNGDLLFSGSGGRKLLNISTNGGASAIVVNEDGNTDNFRIEGDAQTHLFFTDGTNDRVGIRTSTPDSTFTVNGSVRLASTVRLSGLPAGKQAKQIYADANGTLYLGDSTVGGGGGGGTTYKIGTYNSQTSSVKGATIVSDSIYMQAFSAENPGLVPAGGSSSTFLRGDGTWQTVAGGTVYVDSVSNNAGGDSLIVYKNGVRRAYLYPSGGSSGWALTGNDPTSGWAQGSFLGTTTNKSLLIRTNNILRARIDSAGAAGIFRLYPAEKTDTYIDWGTTANNWTINGSGIALTATGGAVNVTSASTATAAFYNGELIVGSTSATGTTKLRIDNANTTKSVMNWSSTTKKTTAADGDWTRDANGVYYGKSTTWNEILMTASVNSVSPTSPNRTITVVIGGTTYYIHAKTTND